MVDERDDRYDGQEEGEYHFSEDQGDYDLVEPEVVKAASSGDKKDALVTGFSKYRRLLIGVSVFAALMFVVYKMLSPSAPPQPTDFSSTASVIKPAQTIQVAPKLATVQNPATPAPVAAVNSAPAPMPVQTNETPVVIPAPTVAPAPPSAVASPQPQMAQAPATVDSQQQMPTVPVNPAPSAPPVVVMDGSPNKASATDRIAFVEQQNLKMQTEYAQKLSEYETQNRVLQGKLQNLTMRLASLEASLSQLTQVLQGGNKQLAMMGPPTTAAPMPRTAEPKMIYTVQAIIPGRAWLKSDAGDTVTVAEGDVLKDYGRIMKIDPYDGTVEIDTGNKTLTLSYGINAG